ncbi:hypothetical protein ET33_23720 [Paenibacillus tyrfis]|uniref:Uncharacterized protein n=1 Tax=Paenibacillus tyrfis TaxID=1501230 RepID=A0A081NVB8_9BACL|nr:hypothetical protein ET33_23720 [Paenibacillus tyrfis]
MARKKILFNTDYLLFYLKVLITSVTRPALAEEYIGRRRVFCPIPFNVICSLEGMGQNVSELKLTDIFRSRKYVDLTFVL